jgi:DNA-binding Xre family transcriptional regulator
MFILNIKKILTAKGISNYQKFLKSAGFSTNQTYYLLSLSPATIRLANLEKLCIALNCTPNDLIEWTPQKSDNIPQSHQLFHLKPKETFDFKAISSDIPVSKLPELKSIIENFKSNIK